MLQHSLGRAQREATPVSLIVLDIDNFKQVNDVHGHQAGDAVLREFAGALRGRLRAADSFSRLGGEEFGIILTGADSEAALRVAEELRLTVEALEVRLTDGRRLRITTSLAVSTAARGRVPTPEEFFAEADRALYEAKRSGRNRVECCATAPPH
jgi:two-component system cell cycle response regulator